ncbi:MAG: hypothetical protein M0P61_05125 [Ignavibacteriaceae bacterium]|jgi:flagellar motility protein MotE (MotC chaperone)|nr:hypothetical protein [Ignavibacteriaceae bacterium]
MKNNIIYIGTFVAAFLLITGAFIFLNSYYVDIFHFNFAQVKVTPKKLPVKISSVDSALLKEMKSALKEMKSDLLDSLKSVNKQNNPVPLTNRASNDSILIDSLNKYIVQIVKDAKKNQLQAQDKKKGATEKAALVVSTAEIAASIKHDSSYFSWKKQTASLYEMMEPKKAAKIIQNFSDNIARDILYSMKKKKAAEILAQLNPETANRITKAQ